MSIEAAGGTTHWLEAPNGIRLRAAHWPQGPRGTVLLLNGRTEFIEKYLEPIAELQSRGFAVWTLDWRGQGLSSRLLPDPILHHVNHFDDYLNDLDLLLDQHILPGPNPRPLILMAHSMGGNIAARMLARRPLFARAILCAPMINFLSGGPLPRQAARLIIQAACLIPGNHARPGPGAARAVNLDRPFQDNKLTHCPTRYAADMDLLRANPALHVGGVTWGWLRAASASIAALHRPALPPTIGAPVLIAVAGQEQLVDNPAMRRFAQRLPKGETLEIDGARHELLREHDDHRIPFWAGVDRFLAPV